MSCKMGGHHDLLDINRVKKASQADSWKVTRWCHKCGAIVVDVDVDGRVFAGSAMEMQFPKICQKEFK